MPEPIVDVKQFRRRSSDKWAGRMTIIGTWLKKSWWIALVLIFSIGISLSGFHFQWKGFTCEKTEIKIKKGETGVGP